MLLFSIAHFYCFPTYEWEPDYRVNFNKFKISQSLALGDFVNDLKLIMNGNNNGNGNRRGRKHLSKEPSEPSVPEVDEEAGDGDEEFFDSTETEGGENETVTSDVTANTSLAEDVASVLASSKDAANDSMGDDERKEIKGRIDTFLRDTAFLPGLTGDLASPYHRLEGETEVGSNADERGESKASVEEGVSATGADDGGEGDASNDAAIVSLPYGSDGDSQEGAAPGFRRIDWEREEADTYQDIDPSESTSLLGSNKAASTSAPSMRPSIFTKVAEMNTPERMSRSMD